MKNSRKCHNTLKEHNAANSKKLRQLMPETYQEALEGTFYHMFLNAHVTWITGDKIYETPQEIINRIRVEGN